MSREPNLYPPTAYAFPFRKYGSLSCTNRVILAFSAPYKCFTYLLTYLLKRFFGQDFFVSPAVYYTQALRCLIRARLRVNGLAMALGVGTWGGGRRGLGPLTFLFEGPNIPVAPHF